MAYLIGQKEHQLITPEHYYPVSARRVIEKCFADPQVNHKGIDQGENYQPLVEYLIQSGCLLETIRIILSGESSQKWNPALSHPEFPVWSVAPDELFRTVKDVTRPILIGSQYSLDRSSKYDGGFNDHREGHIHRVSYTANQVLREQGYGDDVLWRTQVGVLFHDVSNILSRSLHQHGGPEFLSFLFPQFCQDQQQLKIINRAMHLHTEKVAVDVFNVIKNQLFDRVLTDEEFYRQLLIQLGPEALALIIGDKTDIGPERSINTRSRHLTAQHLLQDPHLAVNAFARTVGFTTRAQDAQGRRIARWDLTHSSNYAAQISIKLYREILESRAGLPFSAQEWLKKMLEIYSDRVSMVATSTFGVAPVEELHIVVREHAPAHSNGLDNLITLRISRDHAEEDIAKIQEKYQV